MYYSLGLVPARSCRSPFIIRKPFQLARIIRRERDAHGRRHVYTVAGNIFTGWEYRVNVVAKVDRLSYRDDPRYEKDRSTDVINIAIYRPKIFRVFFFSN